MYFVSSLFVRYYCCLFLARMNSAPLIKLDADTCVAIDGLIDTFLEKHVPREISRWEEETSFVWMTMVPLVHLAFAAGKESCYGSEMNGCNHGDYYHGLANNDLSCKTLQSESGSKQSQSTVLHEPASQNKSTMTQMECTPSVDMTDSGNCDTSLCCDKMSQRIMWKSKQLGSQLAAEIAETSLSSKLDTMHEAFKASDASASKTEGCKMASPGANFKWPGSKSIQKLGIFSLVHMLSIKENQQLALSENLVAYLVCLSWQLNSVDKEKICESLSNFQPLSPPSLKVAAKSVLARVNGLDMVFNS